MLDPAYSKPYMYEDLPTQGWFRLLEIEPFENSTEPISCHLQTQKISSEFLYQALSYTWGDEAAECLISIDHREFLVRRNLHSALQAVRSKAETKVIWVDAICINQNNEDERNYQVRQMNKIFSNATIVNVWLGEASPSSDLGIDFLQKFNSTLNEAWNGVWPQIGSTFQEGPDESIQAEDEQFNAVMNSRAGVAVMRSREGYDAYYRPVLRMLEDSQCFQQLEEAVELLRRPWWKRMWTLQESVLCRHVVCLCGTRAFRMDYFYALASYIYFSISYNAWTGPKGCIDSAVALRAAWRTADLSNHISKTGKVRLILALDSSWNRRASDPKDKVIGLLGLVGQRDDLVPEYGWPVEKIYRSAVRAALQEEENLSCLGFMSENATERSPALPSWVPDFEIHSDPGSDQLAALSKPIYAPLTYNASLDAHINGGVYAPISTEEDDTILVLEGILVDTVETVGSKAPGWTPENAEPHKTSLGEWKETMTATVHEWRSLLQNQNVPYRTGESCQQAFWRTVLVDLKHGERLGKSDALGPQRLGPQDLQFLETLDTPSGLDRLVSNWDQSSTPGFRQLRLIEQFNRRYFTTSTGYTGLGPPSLQKDDAICVLFGGTVTYSLRRSGNGNWRYIGECYTHGIMDGEAVKEAKQNRLPYQTFRIE